MDVAAGRHAQTPLQPGRPAQCDVVICTTGEDHLLDPPADRVDAAAFAAAQDFQFAAETSDDDGSPHGLFTWALLKVLRSMPVNESADRMFLQLRAMMQAEPRRPSGSAGAGRVRRARRPNRGRR